MKSSGKIAFFCFLICLLVSTPVFSQKSLEDFKTIMDDFTATMAKSLPFNASMGLNWGDAYIGKFLGIPPHFGAGLSLGWTTMDGSSLGGLMDQFDLNLPIDFGSYPMFGYALEGRLGGFVLPFDIGVKFGVLPLPAIAGFKLDYLVTGADFRYAVLEGEKGKNLLLPVISLGMGFNYLSGGLSKEIGQAITFKYNDPLNGGNPETLTLAKPKLGITWETFTLDFKAHISKTFLLVTPYAGLGASIGWSKAGYGVETTITDSAGRVNSANAGQVFKQFGIDNIDPNGFSTMNEFDGWSIRFFGGLTFKVALLKIDLTYMGNFVDKNYGLTIASRVQI